MGGSSSVISIRPESLVFRHEFEAKGTTPVEIEDLKNSMDACVVCLCVVQGVAYMYASCFGVCGMKYFRSTCTKQALCTNAGVCCQYCPNMVWIGSRSHGSLSGRRWKFFGVFWPHQTVQWSGLSANSCLIYEYCDLETRLPSETETQQRITGLTATYMKHGTLVQTRHSRQGPPRSMCIPTSILVMKRSNSSFLPWNPNIKDYR